MTNIKQESGIPHTGAGIRKAAESVRFLAACLALAALTADSSAMGPRTEAVKPAQAHVSTTPPGAGVFLNGVHQGQTPLTLLRLPAGEHLLVLKKSGFREARTTITARPGERMAVDINLELITGIVLIHSTPSDANVEINDSNYGKTPLLLPKMPLGDYRLRISAAGHLPKTMELKVADRIPRSVNAALISDSARVIVKSTPPGAEVTVGGVARGTTPYTMETAPSGKHQFSLALTGYLPYSDEFTVKAGDRRNIDVKLTPVPGRMEVTSQPPGARVYLSDQAKGETPLSITNLVAGKYMVRAELRGFESMTKTNVVAFGGKTVVEFELVKNSGTLLISTEPPGVKLHVDGEDHGSTTASGDEPVSTQLQIDFVPQGQRQLQLTKPGYFDLVKTVEVAPDRMVVLHEKLKARPVPFVPNMIIRIGPGPEHSFSGVFREQYGDGVIRLELEPGIFRDFSPQEILSREHIKQE